MFTAIVIGWAVCAILTAAHVLPDDPEQIGYLARTDAKIKLVHDMPWFYFPTPG